MVACEVFIFVVAIVLKLAKLKVVTSVVTAVLEFGRFGLVLVIVVAVVVFVTFVVVIIVVPVSLTLAPPGSHTQTLAFSFPRNVRCVAFAARSVVVSVCVDPVALVAAAARLVVALAAAAAAAAAVCRATINAAVATAADAVATAAAGVGTAVVAVSTHRTPFSPATAPHCFSELTFVSLLPPSAQSRIPKLSSRLFYPSDDRSYTRLGVLAIITQPCR